MVRERWAHLLVIAVYCRTIYGDGAVPLLLYTAEASSNIHNLGSSWATRQSLHHLDDDVVSVVLMVTASASAILGGRAQWQAVP